MQNRKKYKYYNKRSLRASGLSLLPLALRPLLLVFLMTGFVFIFQTANVSAKSVTLTIPSTPLTLNVEPNNNTVFKKSSPGTISVATDSSYGYSLSIQSKTSNDLLNGSNKISSIVSALSESDYENSSDANTWAYLPSKLGGSINTDFQPGPTTEPTTLDRVESSSEGTDYNLTLATKIDNTLPAGNYSNTFVLSATSNDPPYDDIIQNWADCDTLESEQSLNLLDVRDNKIYSVAKLKDGLCWMTENLSIGSNESTTELTSDTTDLPSGTSSYTLPQGSTSGFWSDDNAVNIYIGSQIYNDDSQPYAGYYTWKAATAGIGNSMSSGEISGSICPKGWKLPTGSEYSTMFSKYNNNTNGELLKSPASFTLSGYYENSSFKYGGSYGYWWQSTANVGPHFWNLQSIYGGGIGSSHGYDGFSVRCVARPDNPKKVGTMQTVDEWGDSVEEGKTVISEDVRDNKQYTVARLADGRLWMTKNLEIGKIDSEMKLTSDTSDTASDFTLLASSDAPNPGYVYDSRDIHLDSTYGGYYSWYTATAGEGTQQMSSGDVSHSICPKGWRLPTKQDFINLDKSFGGTGQSGQSSSTNVGGSKTLLQMYQDPPASFLMGGLYSVGNPNYVGSDAFYWSSTAANAGNAYSLRFNSSIVYPQNTLGKFAVASVRCVSRSDDPREVGSLQTVDEWGDSVKQGKTVISEDIRDDKKYTASRLADGRLWMTQNLGIAGKTLTSSDSDVAGDFVLPASVNSPNSSNAYNQSFVHVDGEYGGYYTWFAATAGDGKQSVSTDGQNVEHSICPKGWRLPTKQDFIDLDKAFDGTGQNNQSSSTSVGGGKTLLQMYQNPPVNFLMGGGYDSGNPNLVGNRAFYWSSTAYSANYAHSLGFRSSYVYPQDTLDKSCLASVRCVSRTDDPTMQNVEKWGSSVQVGETKTVPDIRDGKEYTVARLADNKLWMTKNLAIENTTLEPENSDVGLEFQLPTSTNSPNSSNSYESKELHIDTRYGGYYTWFTATAGEGKQNFISSDTQHSICPKGWRLPSKQDFIDLDRALGGTGANGQSGSTQPNKYMGSPYNFIMGGTYSSGSAYFIGNSAAYWSSTANGASQAYYLTFSSSSVYPQNTNNKLQLSSIRCISRE